MFDFVKYKFYNETCLLINRKSVCIRLVFSKVVAELSHSPLGKPHLPSLLQGGPVLVGLEFGVIVRELVEEDGDGQTVQDDSKRNADERKQTAQDGFWVNVPITHSGDADLQGEKESERSAYSSHVQQ